VRLFGGLWLKEKKKRHLAVMGCERERDPDNTVCRLVGVTDLRRYDITVHQVVTEYLAEHSPVAPTIEGRAVATDAPADLLSPVQGTGYSLGEHPRLTRAAPLSPARGLSGRRPTPVPKSLYDPHMVRRRESAR